MSTVEERSYVEAARREKRAALEARGVPAFAYRYQRTHTALEALALYRDEMGEEGPTVSIAGRLAELRSHGKTVFAHLEDSSGRIQVYFRQDTLGDLWGLVELLDLDDHIGVRGRLFRTKKGEITVRAEAGAGSAGESSESSDESALVLLAKSLRPLPRGKTQETAEGAKTFGGLQDPELRYRQRYADLAVHPEVRRIFVQRAKVVTFIRRFLDERGFLE
ncbi:MAG TPA: OB-fold nucleic acid binding domain-containing protein, partial [Gemmatimonadales bacterium]|nr:OB-fold nucleic acid binding domain-containing protein [Gemmatimonadales bacterium]